VLAVKQQQEGKRETFGKLSAGGIPYNPSIVVGVNYQILKQRV
jgi:hypothetical protein